MIISSLAGAALGLLLGAPLHLITFGLFGYNSVLTGLALWSGPFVKSNKLTFALSVFGAAITAVTFMALDHALGDWFSIGGNGWAIPAFTGPFIITTWVIMYASKRFGWDVWPHPDVPDRAPMLISVHDIASGFTADQLIKDSENPIQKPLEGFKWTPWEFIKASLRGVAQVSFQENWVTGVFWVVGLTLSWQLVAGNVFTNGYTAGWDPASPLFLAGVMAFIGSAIGAAGAIWAKYPVVEIKAGIHGFNQVLVMIALTSFLPLTWVTFGYAILATVACTFFTMPAMQNFFGRWGIPPLTGPFVFTSWIALLALPIALGIPAGIGWGRP